MAELKDKTPEKEEYGSFLYSKDNDSTRKKSYDFGRILFLIAILNIILAVTMLILNLFVDVSVEKGQVENGAFWSTLWEKTRPLVGICY